MMRPRPAETFSRTQLRTAQRMNTITSWGILVSLLGSLLALLGVFWTLRRGDTAMKLDERAWVGASDVRPSTKQDEPVTSVRVIYKNVGKTPALDVRSHVDWKFSESEVPLFDVDPSSSGPSSAFMLLPSGEGNATLPIPVEVARELNDGKGGGFIFGTVWYKDIFGKPHWSQFCFQVAPRLQGFWACKTHTQYDGQ